MPSLLNSDFTVSSFNGGAVSGRMGVSRVLTATPGAAFAPRSTHPGTTFDLVLEYRGDAPISLSHIVFQAPDYSMVTAPLSAGIVWVSETAPDVASYSRKFDEVDADSYAAAPVADAPTPAGFFRFPRRAPAAIAPLRAPASGAVKFVHIKFTESAGSDENIDFGPLFLLGESHADAAAATAAAAGTATRDFGVSPADVSACVASGAMRTPISRYDVNPLTAESEDELLLTPFLCLISTETLATAAAGSPAATAHGAFVAAAAAYHTRAHADATLATAAAAAGSAGTASGAAAGAGTGVTRPSRAVNFVTLDPSASAEVAERLLAFLGHDTTALAALTAAHASASVAAASTAAGAAAEAGEHSSSAFYSLPGLTSSELTEDDDEDASQDPDVRDMTTPLPGLPRAPATPAVPAAPAAGAALTLPAGAATLLIAVDSRGASIKHVFGAKGNEAETIAAALEGKKIAPLAVESSAAEAAGFGAFALAFGLACGERNKMYGDNDDEDADEEADAAAAAAAAAAAEGEEDEEEDDDEDDESKLDAADAVDEVDETIINILTPFFPSAPRPEGDKHPRFPGLTVATHDSFVELVIDCPTPALVLFADISSRSASLAAALLCVFAGIAADAGLAVTPVLMDVTANAVPEKFYNDDIYEQMKLFVKRAPKPAAGAKNKTAKKKAAKKRAAAPKPIATNKDGLEVFVYGLDYETMEDEDEEEDEDMDPNDADAPSITLPGMVEFLREHLPTVIPAATTPAGKALTQAVSAAAEAMEHLGDTTSTPVTLLTSLRQILKIRGADRYLVLKPGSVPAAAIKIYREAYVAGMAAMRALPFPVGTLPVPLVGPTPPGVDLSNTITLVSCRETLAKHAAATHRAFDAIQPIFQHVKVTRALLRMITSMACTHPDVVAATVAKRPAAFARFGDLYTTALEQTGTFAVAPRMPAAAAQALGVNYARADALTAGLKDPKGADVIIDVLALTQTGKALQDIYTTLQQAVAQYRAEHFPTRSEGVFTELPTPLSLQRAAEGFVDVTARPTAPAAAGKGAAGKKGGFKVNLPTAAPARNATAKVSTAATRLAVIFFSEPADESFTQLPALAAMAKAAAAKHGENVAFFHMTAANAAETEFSETIDAFPAFVFLRGGYEMAEYRVCGALGDETARVVGMNVDAQLSAIDADELADALGRANI